jgi:putative FmdB family regulatory protein
MPVYKYRCDNCGVQFEKKQSFSDQPLIRCKECGKKTLKKVYQPVGIVFKPLITTRLRVNPQKKKKKKRKKKRRIVLKVKHRKNKAINIPKLKVTTGAQRQR